MVSLDWNVEPCSRGQGNDASMQPPSLIQTQGNKSGRCVHRRGVCPAMVRISDISRKGTSSHHPQPTPKSTARPRQFDFRMHGQADRWSSPARTEADDIILVQGRLPRRRRLLLHQVSRAKNTPFRQAFLTSPNGCEWIVRYRFYWVGYMLEKVLVVAALLGASLPEAPGAFVGVGLGLARRQDACFGRASPSLSASSSPRVDRRGSNVVCSGRAMPGGDLEGGADEGRNQAVRPRPTNNSHRPNPFPPFQPFRMGSQKPLPRSKLRPAEDACSM